MSAVPAPRTGGPTPTPTPTRATAPPAHSARGHVRATVLLVVLTLLVSGFAYPLVLTGIAQLIDPSAANGSLLPDGNQTVGSSLVAQNLSAPYLFWERPSLTDYNTTLGSVVPYGASDPALAAWLNETLAYMREYGNFTVNQTLPFWYVSPSASALDPDLTPEAVLVQVPRVAEANNLTIGVVTGLVNAHIETSPIPYLGVPYVNVLELDLALVRMTGR
ncbi:MAG: potassium-transporting ATPase subunit C [Thermoplasmata archaeon]